MDIELAKDENLIKYWQYATITPKGLFKSKRTCNLIVTDKRVVHLQTDKSQTERKEVPLKSVTAVESAVYKNRPWILAALITAIGLICIILGAVFLSKNENANFISIVGIVLGVVLIIIAILLLIFRNKLRLSVNIKTNVNVRNTDPISITANAFALKKNHTPKSFRIEVNQSVADDIINTIGIVLIADKE